MIPLGRPKPTLRREQTFSGISPSWGRLVDELPEVLARHVSNDVNWRIATVTETRLDQAGSGVEIIDLARKWKLKEGWDLLICLTDLPLRMVYRVKDFDRLRGFRRYFWKATPVRSNVKGGA